LPQRRIAHHRVARTEFDTLFKQAVDLTVRAQGNDAIAVRMTPNDVQRADANRTG